MIDIYKCSSNVWPSVRGRDRDAGFFRAIGEVAIPIVVIKDKRIWVGTYYKKIRLSIIVIVPGYGGKAVLAVADR